MSPNYSEELEPLTAVEVSQLPLSSVLQCLIFWSSSQTTKFLNFCFIFEAEACEVVVVQGHELALEHGPHCSH